MFDSKLISNKRQTHIQSTLSIDSNNQKDGKLRKAGKSERKQGKSGTNNMDDDNYLWGELRVQGKIIENRSYHISCVFQDCFYVHGGKSSQQNSYGDLYKICLDNDNQFPRWESVNEDGPRLKRHSGVVYKDQWIICGGLDHAGVTNSHIYIYHFVNNQWTTILPLNNIDGIDSHSVCLSENNEMIIFGGFNKQKGSYENSIYKLDLTQAEYKWETIFKQKQKNDAVPIGRCNSSLTIFKNKLYMFGGMNGIKKLDDFWEYSLVTNQFKRLSGNDRQSPCERSGHTVIVYQDKMLLFGGIQDLTKEKNDLYQYNFTSMKWKIIYNQHYHFDVDKHQELYASLNADKYSKNTEQDINQANQYKTIKKYNPLQMSQFQISQKYVKDYHKKQKEDLKKTEKNNLQINAIAEQKSKQKNQNKQNLLNQFEITEEKKDGLRLQTPMTEAMKNSIEIIQHKHENMKKRMRKGSMDQVCVSQMNQEEQLVDYSRQPCPRDGHTLVKYHNYLLIFGGDRHKMTFNDLFIVQLNYIKS